jgi:hypothetical protein
VHKKADLIRYVRKQSWAIARSVRRGWDVHPEDTLMANVEFRYAPGPTVRYLDVSPIISALRFQPDDFEYAHGWLNHVPSRHRFQFDRSGRVAIEAMCDCASLSIKPEQSDELVAMFRTWRQEYWRPLEINREFASHFRKPNAWVRLFRDVRMAFRRFLRRDEPGSIAIDNVTAATTPAE